MNVKRSFSAGSLVVIVIGILLILVFRSGRLASALNLNLLAVNWSDSIYQGDLNEISRITSDSRNDHAVCRKMWYAGFRDQVAGKTLPETSAWAEAIRCDANLIPYLNAIMPESLAWAQFAVEAHPANANAWFWLGDLQEEDLIEYYRTALQIDPADALRWLALGDHLLETDPGGALEAYREACYRGDPGYQGCSRAGDTARDLGDFDSAIDYYLQSDWPAVRNKANQLTPSP